ncbi:MAG: hypothetical protein PF630_03125 [Gammaproteobacteria bacterium]|nr:hypothetical protein [Gammaproteobacteria bacterium]
MVGCNPTVAEIEFIRGQNRGYIPLKLQVAGEYPGVSTAAIVGSGVSSMFARTSYTTKSLIASVFKKILSLLTLK